MYEHTKKLILSSLFGYFWDKTKERFSTGDTPRLEEFILQNPFAILCSSKLSVEKNVKKGTNKVSMPRVLEDREKQRLILGQMEKLHSHLIDQQRKVHEQNLESQREAVRDEMDKMAEVLLATTRGAGAAASSKPAFTPEQRREALAQMKRHRPEMVRALGKKIPGILSGDSTRPPRRIEGQESLANPRVIAWHQRFVDNFKLRKLQSRASRLNARTATTTHRRT